MGRIILPANFNNGFARSAGESAYPLLWQNLAGAWVPRLGHQGLTTLLDFSGLGNHGTLAGSMDNTDWIAGQYGMALDFDGTDDVITTADIAGLDSQAAITYACLVRSASISINRCIVSKNDGTVGPVLQTDGTTASELRFNANTTANRITTSGAGLVSGVWYFIVATFDNSLASNKHRIYVNGIQQTTVDVGTPDASSTSTGASTVGVQIARLNLSSGRYWNGPIAYILVWNRALQPGEIMDLATIGATPFALKVRRNISLEQGEALTLNLSDTISFSDSSIKSENKTLSDAITLAEAISKLTGKPISDSFAVIDTLARLSGKTLAETVALADSVVKSVAKAFSDGVTVTDSISATILLGAALADAFSVGDSILLSLRHGTIPPIALPSLDICATETQRTTPATLGCGDTVQRTALASLGCSTTTRRTALATPGCVTVTRRTNETTTDDGGSTGTVDWVLGLVDTVIVDDLIRLIAKVVDPPVIEGCTDEFPGMYYGTYGWGVAPSQDPNVELTGQQISCAVELLSVQASEEGTIAGKTLGIMFWWFVGPAHTLSGASKAASDNCDPHNPAGNVDVDFNQGYWTLAIAVCVNS